ncbi:hypothetical protein [Brevibacillus sp. SYSU BS000544]|uniref:hypothetical protein n=1 Tax=Brevibacillus sp. SYSU BS000544 TaxID=3416443 RepID=UPI003CE4587C
MVSSLIYRQVGEQRRAGAYVYSLYADLRGYGWHIIEVSIAGKMRKRIGHLGDCRGFVNNFVRYIDEDLVVIVLSNLAITPVEQISTDLASLVLGESIAPIEQIELRTLNTQELELYTGTYVVEGEHPQTIQIIREENAD